ncbi:MAG TPA: c(7)-type cytochrome triheme domain-containing protein [Nitrospiria bacterium]|nr:c(7)-type cytochrome triheme domain-containing protein [Nitrospiria bacterium]
MSRGGRIGAICAGLMLVILYSYGQNRIEAQTTQDQPATAPAQAPVVTPAPIETPPAQTPPAAPPPSPVVTPAPTEPQPSQPPPPVQTPPAAEEEEHPLAFDYLPKTKMGYVDWVAAIKQGVIHPRDSLDPNAVTMKALDFNIIFKVNVSGLPDVVYPHYPHTLWLDCRNCHPGIFLMRAGANPVTMEKILKGEYCGRCHGIVAFPISDCFRCHSRPK